jgi:hypothetical protein
MIDASGGPGYDDARRTLRARYGAAGSPGTAAQALQLVHAVLAGSDPAGNQAAGTRSAVLLAALVVLRHLREEIAGWEPQLIAAARADGVSWTSLAAPLGVTSRQAAERRFLRLRQSETGELTGEQRVAAERAKRAGDRAVTRWARQNSVPLRQLAGQVSTLAGLAASAQAHADRVQRALADDDPSTLLSPLADASAHLAASHAALAGQIDTITKHTEQLRRDTHERRRRPQDAAPANGAADPPPQQ